MISFVETESLRSPSTVKSVQEQSCLALTECMLAASALLGQEEAKSRFVKAFLVIIPLRSVAQEMVQQIFLPHVNITEVLNGVKT
uniref:NR LBD domain-containing protein n=1 Tax=Panagrellus redivivus TaxID=6233 RepID=A0A7E4W9J9_PANRE